MGNHGAAGVISERRRSSCSSCARNHKELAILGDSCMTVGNLWEVLDTFGMILRLDKSH